MFKKVLLLATLLSFSLLFFGFSDLTQKSKSEVKFSGFLGTMMKMTGVGGESKQALYLKGNLLRDDQLDKKGKVESSQIIDLDNELITSIDYKDKKYTQITFEEWKEILSSQMEAFKENQAEATERKDEQQPEVTWEFSVDIDKTGNSKKIAGYKAEEVILTLTAEATATSAEMEDQPSGTAKIIVVSTNWMSEKVTDIETVSAFRNAFAEKIGLMPAQDTMEQIKKSLLTSNPGLAAAMEKLSKESKALNGYALMTHSEFKTESEGGPKAEAEQETNVEIPKSVGGLLGGFGKKLAKDKMKKEEDGPKTVFSMSNEVTELKNELLEDKIFAIPQKFKKEQHPLLKK